MYVPVALRRKLISVAHGDPLLGHIGAEKTIQFEATLQMTTNVQGCPEICACMSHMSVLQ